MQSARHWEWNSLLTRAKALPCSLSITDPGAPLGSTFSRRPSAVKGHGRWLILQGLHRPCVGIRYSPNLPLPDCQAVLQSVCSCCS